MSEAVNVNARNQTASAPSLPDMNAETYSFETVQYLLDQAAYFNLFSAPDEMSYESLITSGAGICGLKLNEKLFRFRVNLQSTTLDRRLKYGNLIGESVGKCNQRWLLMPDDFVAMPEREPPQTLLDTSRSQRFVMLDGVYTFGTKGDGFRGFGTGCTYPFSMNGNQQLFVAAVGSIVEGHGRFSGHEGTYTYSGLLDPQRGFVGNLLFRAIDLDGSLSSENELREFEQTNLLSKGLTFILFRGQKKNRYQKTKYNFSSDGNLEGFTVEQELRRFDLDCAVPRRKSICASKRLGQVVGRMTSKVFLNLLNPGAPGTVQSPVAFTSYNEYAFFDDCGNEIGSFVATGGEGRSFNLRFNGFPEQQALRFGAFQTLVSGKGCFSGIQGLLTDNSAAGVAPHALSTLYVLCINDPDGRFRV
jgi:hypothetical protein